ncbi:MAG: MFS transporter [Maricaulaceae bacterium]|nr:MFS transporter [Maricaulaceae bacterium]
MIAAFLIQPRFARTRSLAAAILSVTLAGCAFGLLMPLTSLNLERMTESGVVVGLNAAMAALSTLVAAPVMPKLLGRFPGRGLILFSLAGMAIGMPLFPLFPDVGFWFGLRFALGMLMTVIFVTSETWINQIAAPERRATILGVYATCLAAGFGAGGLLLAWLGADGFAPWIAGAILFGGGAIPITLLRGPDVEAPDAREAGLGAMWAAALAAPTAIAAALAFGALETIFFSLIPVYGERIGLSVAVIGTMVAAGAAGGILLQIPIGRLADSAGRARTLAGIAAIAAAGPVLMYLAGANAIALYAVMFLYVGVATAFYTVGLSLIGERFRGGAMAGANAAFVFAYGLGSLAGPAAAGAAMDAVNPHGLLIALSVFAAAYSAFAVWRRLRRKGG